MADVKQCDRCKEIYKYNEPAFKVNGGHLRYITLNNKFGCFDRVDLCCRCAKDLWHWLCNEEVCDVEE